MNPERNYTHHERKEKRVQILKSKKSDTGKVGHKCLAENISKKHKINAEESLIFS